MKALWHEKKGIIIFSLIMIIALTGAFATYRMTGPMGIEERFHAATGITPDETGEAGETIAGFFLEGNALLYALVLAVLIAACAFVYHHYRL